MIVPLLPLHCHLDLWILCLSCSLAAQEVGPLQSFLFSLPFHDFRNSHSFSSGNREHSIRVEWLGFRECAECENEFTSVLSPALCPLIHPFIHPLSFAIVSPLNHLPSNPSISAKSWTPFQNPPVLPMLMNIWHWLWFGKFARALPFCRHLQTHKNNLKWRIVKNSLSFLPCLEVHYSCLSSLIPLPSML